MSTLALYSYSNEKIPPRVIENFVREVNDLMQSGADLNQTFFVGDSYLGYSWNPLVSASGAGLTDIVMALIEAGADVNFKFGGKGDGSALYQAAKYGHLDTVKVLIDAGANPDCWTHYYADDKQRDLVSTSALMEAAENGHTEVVKRLLACGLPADAALLPAAEKGHTDCLSALLAASRNVNHNNRDATALSVACANGMVECANMLIAAGGALNYPEYWSPLQMASRHNQVDCIKAIISSGKQLTDLNKSLSLRDAVDNGHAESAYLLLNIGANPNAVHQFHRFYMETTPLLYVAKKGEINILDALIAKGANIDFQDTDGNTALIVAMKKEHIDCVAALLKAGANVSLTDKSGMTASMIAEQKKMGDAQKLIQSSLVVKMISAAEEGVAPEPARKRKGFPKYASRG
jgi:ankyrin repeat protein